ncbi:MAG: DUF3343 domain-containing protein [Campylobacteraceae bacterium]|nr:DUF3343 domain-containing protein [Campylobacteraceae bacterium]
MDSGYILFATTAAAFMVESVLKEKNIKVKLTPTPRFLSSDCGISAYFWDVEPSLVKEHLEKLDTYFEIIEHKDESLEKR